MAKAKATCTCKTCGGTFIKEAYKRNRAEASSWEAWAAEHFDECPACYGKRKREEERSTPVYAEFWASPLEQEYHFILRGNTYPFKDAAKEMGFRWQEEPVKGALGIFSMSAPRKTWVLTCKADGIQSAAERLVGAGVRDPEPRYIP